MTEQIYPNDLRWKHCDIILAKILLARSVAFTAEPSDIECEPDGPKHGRVRCYSVLSRDITVYEL